MILQLLSPHTKIFPQFCSNKNKLIELQFVLIDRTNFKTVTILLYNMSKFFNVANYYFAKTIEKSFDDAIKLVTEGLKTEGFGIITEIRMDEKFKEKLGVDFKKYVILGACNPSYAYKALQMEDKIGAMLPCNVLVIDQGNGKTEVAAINPVASMRSIPNPNLYDVAHKVSQTLKHMVDHI